jgi:hypothetical protein
MQLHPCHQSSAGYNVYVSKDRALELGLVNVTDEFVYMLSGATNAGPRESIRLARFVCPGFTSHAGWMWTVACVLVDGR